MDKIHLIEEGVKLLILNPQYVAIQIVMTGMLTYSIFPCTSRPPTGKYGSIAGLGYRGSCGHDQFYLAEWEDRVTVLGEFWEEGCRDDFEGCRCYFSSDQRKKIIKQFKARKKAKELVFSTFEKKQYSWDNTSVVKPMIMKRGLLFVAWFPTKYKKQIINEARQQAKETLKLVGVKHTPQKPQPQKRVINAKPSNQMEMAF